MFTTFNDSVKIFLWEQETSKKEVATQGVQIDGFTEKEQRIVRLENVGDVLFQAFLLDNMAVENKKINVELYTIYYIKESGL